MRRYEGIVAAAIRRTAAQYGFTLRRSDHDDFCAEVFAGLLANDMAALRSFEGRCRLSTWLTILARRSFLKNLRRIRGRDTLASEDQINNSLLPQTIDLLERLVADEDQKRLRRAMERLRDGDRRILELFFCDELSYRQIGEQMGISVNAVGPKLFRAQQRLKKAMQWA